MSATPAVSATSHGRWGDVFGGLASVLVALPSAVAFGLLVYAPLGRDAAAEGALAGVLGTILLGALASMVGGAPRLVSAPCAPAAAVLSGLATALVASGGTVAGRVPLQLGVVAMLAGLLQLAFGLLGGGRLIKFVPYPVVAGYMTGVGLIVVTGQLPRMLGLAPGVSWWKGLGSPSLWTVSQVIVGGVAIAAMLLAPRLTRAVPAPLIAMAFAVAAYFVVARFEPSLATLDGNPWVVGRLPGSLGEMWTATVERGHAATSLGWADLAPLFVPAGTLAVLLSIDSLKTAVVLDALTRGRHDSNRTLVGQGLGNFVSGLSGGMPGAGTMGATLVNVSSGGRTRWSGVFTAVFAALVLVLLGPLLAWLPFAALAGILVVVGLRMVDLETLRLLRQWSTTFDFAVVAAVVATALAVGLMPASGVGVGLAVLLFLRDQIRASVVRRRLSGRQVSSKRRRNAADRARLAEQGEALVFFELQGPLFFGTADQLMTELDPFLEKARFVVLQMRRVSALDFTAAHVLGMVESRLAEREGSLLLSELPPAVAGGRNVRQYLEHVGLVQPMSRVRVFDTSDEALEWAEDQLLDLGHGTHAAPLQPDAFDVLAGLDADERALVWPLLVAKSLAADEKLFGRGDPGDALFLVRAGRVRVLVPLAHGRLHLATFGRGDFFGEIAFLDGGNRTADAVAASAAELYVLSRKDFDAAVGRAPAIGGRIWERLARALALRLRQADEELRSLQEA